MRKVGIRGAGLAGLALAQALKRRSPDIDITLFERRARFPHPQRTFCFFDTVRSSVRSIPAVRWTRVRFSGASFSRVVECEAAPYCLVRGDDFFGATVKSLEEAGVNFVWEAGDVTLRPTEVVIRSEVRPFDIVVDAAFDVASARPALWQSFAGLSIETAEPFFDPSEALLMELADSTVDSPVQFMYVLPFSRTAALVEHTTFSFTPCDEAYHLDAVTGWLAQNGVAQYREVSRERGLIPMGLTGETSSGVPVIGTAGGGVRAGTGYGFQGIHRQADELATEICRGGVVSPTWRYDPTPSVLRIGDALLLRALKRRPSAGGGILAALLKRAPDAALVSFLNGDATVLESLRVMACVPKRRMIGALWC